MRIWHAGLALALVITLGLILAVLKPQPYVAMAPTGDAVSVASDVPEAEALPAEMPTSATGDSPTVPRTDRAKSGMAFQREAAAPVETPAAVTISQDVPTANVGVPDAAVRPQDEPGPPPPGLDPGNGPPPGPPPDDDDTGPPPGGGPPPGMRPPN